ncbi:MAG TPA: right-handed parallel beta-helix repeat-containing protein, partial [Sandaracinaceae bacterium LLY-WYZ-13_1]|nr:right-handed parallel beta-helix repeat-containing protein [Sandaracinaceae bacterium LLY-WYZ-13_1]
DTGAGDAGSTTDGGPDPIDPTRCDCDREILPGEATVELSELSPGSTVCLRADTAAERGPLTLVGLAGTTDRPIVVRNCDGAVRLVSPDVRSALRVPAGSHFRISGAGAVGVSHGLRLSAPSSAHALLLLRVHHYEIEHLEVDASDYAAIMAKVDPDRSACAVGDRRSDPFVMEGVHIHDNHLHDVPGEGLYLGSSFYGGTTVYCGETQYPHVVRDVRVERNLIERTGWDGLQVGGAIADCVIADNVVRDFGRAAVGGQNHGIQVGAGSSCEVARNLIDGGPVGMQIAGLGGTVVHHNVVAATTGQGLYVNPRPSPLPSDVVDRGYLGPFVLAANTFVAPRLGGAVIADINVPGNPVPGGNRLLNNLVVSGGPGFLQLTDRYGWDAQGNLRFDDEIAAGLIGTAGVDLCLAPDSPAVDAGVDLASLGLGPDFEGRARPRGGGWDVGALECH